MRDSEDLAIAKLLLDIKAPILEECWEEGFQVATIQNFEENPYKRHTANYYHWQEGWWAGKFALEKEIENIDRCSNSTFEEDLKEDECCEEAALCDM